MRDKWNALSGSTFLRFAVVGVINTLVGTAIMFGLYNLAKMDYWLSSVVNYGLTSVLSFFLNKHFTFRDKEGSAAQAIRFALNIAVCYLLAYGMARPLTRFLLREFNETFRDNTAMLVGMVLFALFNYIGQRFFAFSSHWRERFRGFTGPEGRKKRLLLALVLIALGFFLLNCLTPLYADDFSYSFTFAVTENKFRIRTLGELLQSQRNHYRVLNGRAVTHTLAQLFLMGGKPLFDFVNAIAFTALGPLLRYHAFGTLREMRAGEVLAVYAALWLLPPAFGQSFLWLTGACNYLYGPLLVLLFLIPYRREAGERRGVLSALGTAMLSALGGLIAGWTNENTTVALSAMLALFILRQLLERKPLQLWMVTGLAGALVGADLLLRAPGERARLVSYGGPLSLGTMTQRGWEIARTGLIPVGLPMLIGLVCAAIFLRRTIGQPWQERLETVSVGLIFSVGAMGSVFSMTAAPYFPERAWSGPVMLGILTALYFYRVAAPLGLPVPARRTVAALGALLCVVTVGMAARDLWGTTRAFLDREASIAEQKAMGARDVTVAEVLGHTRWNPFPEKGELNADLTQWPNTALALYYEVDSVAKE